MVKFVLFRNSLFWWTIVEFIGVNAIWFGGLKNYDDLKPEEMQKPVCSDLYERCEDFECCEGYECNMANKGDEQREAFLFFCADPKKNDTENMLGLNDFVFYNPDVFPD